MIPCSGFIEEVQNVRTSTRYVLYSLKFMCCHLVSSCGNYDFIKNQIYPFTFKYSHIALIFFQIKQ